MGFVVVTHPFHPLIGQRLEVLYVKRRAGDTVVAAAVIERGVDLTDRHAVDSAIRRSIMVLARDGVIGAGAVQRQLPGGGGE